MSSDDVRETITTDEVARLLNLTLHGVQGAIVVRRRMHATKRGGRWFVSEGEVERYRMFHLHGQGSGSAVSKAIAASKAAWR